MRLTVDALAARRDLSALAQTLNAAGRENLSRAMGHEVQKTVAAHFEHLDATRHATAQRLGATPSGHWARAAEKVAAPAALEADGATATLTINHMAATRALRDVTIRPRNAKALAIPVHALAYNRQPSRVWESLRLFIKNGAIWQKRAEGEPLRLWVLVRSVTQPQDRTLLPSDEELQKAALQGALNELREFLEK